MAIGKGGAEADGWTAVAASSVAIGTAIDLRTVYGNTIVIDCALDSATAHNGTEFLVLTSTHDDPSPDGEFWAEHATLIMCTGTAATENLTNNPLAALDTVITVAATAGFQANGNWRFIKDGTLANSEMFYQRSYSVNTSLTARWGVTRQHAVNTPMWSIAAQRKVVTHPDDLWAIVVVNNAYHVGGSSAVWRVRYTTLDSL